MSSNHGNFEKKLEEDNTLLIFHHFRVDPFSEGICVKEAFRK